MNAQTKITLSTETIAEALRREGVTELRDWGAVSTKNAWGVHLADGRVGTGATILEAINNAEHVVQVAA
jgi:hypothetical protein